MLIEDGEVEIEIGNKESQVRLSRCSRSLEGCLF